MQACTSTVCLADCVVKTDQGDIACPGTAGRMVYHGPRPGILPFFESLGMHCPPRKADSDFLQEVTSRKDQEVSAPPLVLP